MSIVAKVRERTYEFDSQEDLARARELYSVSINNQDGFESELEAVGIDFIYDI